MFVVWEFAMSALRALLSEVVDYAGLFPPAALPLPAVIKNYEEYVPSENNWMLARLILPADRLSEFATLYHCLLYTSPSPRDLSTSRMPSSA